MESLQRSTCSSNDLYKGRVSQTFVAKDHYLWMCFYVDQQYKANKNKITCLSTKLTTTIMWLCNFLSYRHGLQFGKPWVREHEVEFDVSFLSILQIYRIDKTCISLKTRRKFENKQFQCDMKSRTDLASAATNKHYFSKSFFEKLVF